MLARMMKNTVHHEPELMFFIYIPVLSTSGYSVPSLTSRAVSRRVSGNFWKSHLQGRHKYLQQDGSKNYNFS